ncbi:hypothetical protein [Salinivirga cyanobacteriivorans]
MEEFLETIITVLIGLGAFLISAFRKRKSTKESNPAENNEVNEFFSDEEDEYINSENYIFTSEEEENIKMADSVNSKEDSAMPEEFSANDPPEKEKQRPEKLLYNSPEKHSKSKAVLKQSRKQGFNARKAIIYATIINRKYS